MLSYILLMVSLIGSLHQGFSSPSHPTEASLSPSRKANDGITFSAHLIHRSSPGSPFFTPNYTREDHIKNGVLNSQARSQYFSQIKQFSKGYVAAPLSGWDMLMQYTMGTPSVTSYGIFDTGSSFTWIQCLPCTHCYKQGDYPVFNPNQSSSYQVIQCYDPQCSMAPGSSCRSSKTDDICLYKASYNNNWSSQGVIASETLTLSADNTSRTVPNVVFGCGHDNHNRRNVPGIVGVGNHSASLIRQLSVSHFSQYVIANKTHLEGMVYFGPGAAMSDIGFTTPLLPSEHGMYYLNLNAISVDGSALDFPPGIFENTIDETDLTASGFIIDSGTRYTSLRAEAFDTLVTAIMDVMSDHIPESTSQFELCYKDIRDAPEVIFEFSDLEFVLCDANLWVRHQGYYCLAVIRLKESQSKVSILGFYQQRNAQVGYDLQNNLLSLMYPEACPDDVIDFLEP